MSLIAKFKEWCYAAPEPHLAKHRVSRAVNVPAAPVKPQDRGFQIGDEIWIYQPPAANRLLITSDLNITEGDQPNHVQQTDINRWAVVVEAHCYAGSSEYWRQPSERGILTTIQHLGFRTLTGGQLVIKNGLRSESEPLGLWLKVRMQEYVPAELKQLSPF